VAVSRAERRRDRQPRVEALFGGQAVAALDVLELTEYAWHDCYGEITPPEQVVDDILVVAEGDLAKLVRAARLAVTDWRDLRLAADSVRARGSVELDNPSAQPGKAHKYARVERERCWLMREPPDPSTAVAIVEVTDVYFPGTRLRLRRMLEVEGRRPPVYKLTQKVPGHDHRRLTTNTYLTEAEYELLSRLDGHRLVKMRYSVPPFGIDVFLPPLDGLVLAEMEYDSDEAMVAGEPPEGVIREVTGDVRYTGGHLAASLSG